MRLLLSLSFPHKLKIRNILNTNKNYSYSNILKANTNKNYLYSNISSQTSNLKIYTNQGMTLHKLATYMSLNDCTKSGEDRWAQYQIE